MERNKKNLIKNPNSKYKESFPKFNWSVVHFIKSKYPLSTILKVHINSNNIDLKKVVNSLRKNKVLRILPNLLASLLFTKIYLSENINKQYKKTDIPNFAKINNSITLWESKNLLK